MSDLISRTALIEELENFKFCLGDIVLGWVLDRVIERVKQKPAVNEVCLQEIISYIDRAFERQRFDSAWIDERGEKTSADVGYGGEWWCECMKTELLRVFGNRK